MFYYTHYTCEASLLHVSICVDFCVNVLQQSSHVYIFTPACISWCLSKLDWLVNVLLQCWHWYGFSPVWTCVCIISALLLGNISLHTPHSTLLLLTPLCTLVTCTSRLLFWLNVLWHSSHVCGLTPVCTLSCVITWLLYLKSLSQYWHLSGLWVVPSGCSVGQLGCFSCLISIGRCSTSTSLAS